MPAVNEWKTGEGRIIRFEDMDDKHLVNTALYINRRLVTEPDMPAAKEQWFEQKLTYIYHMLSNDRRVNRFAGMDYRRFLDELDDMLVQQDEARARRTGQVQTTLVGGPAPVCKRVQPRPQLQPAQPELPLFRKLII